MVTAAGVLAVLLVAQGGGGGGGGGVDRVWPGIESRQCGAVITVVETDGAETEYHPPVSYLDGLPTVDIAQGEMPRRAYAVHDRLAEDAAAVTFHGCDGRIHAVARDEPERVWLVLTGRGTFKVTHERRGGVFIDRGSMVHRIEWKQ